MNYTHSPIQTLADCFNDCFRRYPEKPSYDEIQVYAMFPQVWGSTALGFGGIGGQALTTAYTIVLYCSQIGKFYVYIGGRFAYDVDHRSSKFLEHVKNQNIEGLDGKWKYAI